MDNMEMLMDKPKKEVFKDPNIHRKHGNGHPAATCTGTWAGSSCPSRIFGRDKCFSFSISFHIPLWGIELLLVVPYIVSQLFGVVLGAAMAKLMTTEGIYARAQGAAFTILQTEEQLGQAVFGEIAMTCLLTVVARCCQQQEQNSPATISGWLYCHH
ncbi:hypothetical protein P4O66_007527 [Electrophorus voltai]|uniref:Uncharacterized protein n=1 Tax=Electrophorus voltai TaxID=2609070 RepID=A0AAD8ZHH2_9TELE|nr:hypothetical protein P4O66_007527 [Electrophorus voltai]